MQRLLIIVAAAALAVLAAGPAFAQQGQGKGQQQGKGNSEQKGQAKGQQQGKGNSEQAPKGYAKGQQPGFYPPGITQNPWFSNAAVRQELRLTDEQFGNLNKAWGRSWNDFQTGAKGLSDEQRAKRMTDLTNKFNQSFNQSLKSMLKAEQQMNRYNQLNFQRGGFSFLDNNDILTQLNLNQQQLAQLQNAQAQFNANIDRIDWSDPQQGMSSYYGQLPRVGQTMNGILTPEQQLTWDRLFGQPFNFLVNGNAP